MGNQAIKYYGEERRRWLFANTNHVGISKATQGSILNRNYRWGSSQGIPNILTVASIALVANQYVKDT